MTRPSGPPKFSVIPGGRDRNWQFGELKLWIAVAHESPFFPDFELIEEDTWRVIGAGRKFREVHDHPIRIMTDAIEQTALEPGSCLRRGRRVFLVMHEIEQEPVCRPEWIDSALACALRCVDRQQGTSLSLLPPGVEYGRLRIRQSLELLTRALQNADCQYLRKVWLQVRRQQMDSVAGLLDELSGAHSPPAPT